MSHPLVPFATTVDSWDHHWFLWLPHHPVYESVEVASREPDRDGRVAVWVWFTERAGAKRQIHYRNDPRLAAVIGGNYRPIAYQISGDDGRPRGVQVRFDDIENMPVEIDVEFDPDQTLSRQGAGLTDQSGHMSDRAFLVFHRDTQRAGPAMAALRSETATTPSVVTRPKAHFLSGGRTATEFPSTSFSTIPSRPGSVRTDMRRRPRPMACMCCLRPGGGSVSLRSDQSGQLEEYVDRDADGDFFRVVFDPPLPPCGRDNQPQSSSFSISIKAAADLVRGRVETRCGDHAAVLDWHPNQPLWASKQPFRSEISRPDDHSVSVVVTSAR